MLRESSAPFFAIFQSQEKRSRGDVRCGSEINYSLGWEFFVVVSRRRFVSKFAPSLLASTASSLGDQRSGAKEAGHY